MTEFVYFLRFLKKRAYILLLVPVIAMVASYFLTRQLPDTYRAQGRIATGIVDKTEQFVVSENAEQESEINRKFDNLIQLMRMKRVLDQVSYQLLLHDLTVPQDSAFHSPPERLQAMTSATKRQVVTLLRQKHGSRQDLNLAQPREASVADLIERLNYDAASLLEKLTIYRIASSDYINLEFEAPDPRLAAFVINTLGEEFLGIYAQRLLDSNDRTLAFFEKMMLQKRDALNERMGELKAYKIQNKVLNLNEQARSLYGHIIDFETRREVARKDVVAYKAALNNIDQRFDPADRRYMESALSDINQRIALTKEQLQRTSDSYIKTDFDPRLKSRVDSLQQELSKQIRLSSDRNIYNPLSAKGDLVSHKLELEISLEMAQNSISTIEAEVNRLNRKYDGMVPNEASIQQFETGIDIAGKEYIEALQRYNNARLESFAPITLKMVEKAQPGEEQPSKKMLLVALTGLASFVLCLFAFFVTYFLDNSVRTTAQLADLTGIPVLGRLNRVPGGKSLLNLDSAKDSKAIAIFKDLIRSIRYEIDEETANPKILTITSLQAKAGKTDLVYGLAWAYARVNQRVLIIDGNFDHPTISQQNGPESHLETFLQSAELPATSEAGNVDIMGTSGGDRSLLEMVDEKWLQQSLAQLKRHYDVVLIEAPALTAMNKAKEWLAFSDRIVAVLSYGRTVKDEDKAKLNYLRSRGAILSGWVLSGTADDIEPVGKSLVKI